MKRMLRDASEPSERRVWSVGGTRAADPGDACGGDGRRFSCKKEGCGPLVVLSIFRYQATFQTIADFRSVFWDEAVSGAETSDSGEK